MPASAAQPDTPFSIERRELHISVPLRWPAAGWRDFTHAPGIGLFYGVCFMLMGPILCLALCQVSMKLERDERPGLRDSLTAWNHRWSQLAIFGGVLLILEMLRGRAALIVFAVNGMPDLTDSITQRLNPKNLGFITAYLSVDGVFAGLIYSLSVVSMPMLLDRSVDAVTADLTRLRLVLTQTGAILLWGAVITGLVVLALLTWFAGLLVVVPVLGHASWHAYRSVVVHLHDSKPDSQDTMQGLHS